VWAKSLTSISFSSWVGLVLWEFMLLLLSVAHGWSWRFHQPVPGSRDKGACSDRRRPGIRGRQAEGGGAS
jgi:hypothetical protein